MDAAIVEAVMTDWKSAPVSGRIRAALQLLEALTVRPQEVDRGLVMELESAGLNPSEIEEVASVAFHFNLMNRAADAFDFAMLDPEQSDRQSRFLRWIGRVLPCRKAPRPSFGIDDEGQLSPAELMAARQQLLAQPGSTAGDLRAAVMAHAGSLRGGPVSPHRLPAELLKYVEALALHAYWITDAMAEDLKAAGYSEEAIFEVTLVGAFGAVAPAFDRLYEGLYRDAGSREP